MYVHVHVHTGLVMASTKRPVMFRDALATTLRGVFENSAMTVFRPVGHVKTVLTVLYMIQWNPSLMDTSTNLSNKDTFLSPKFFWGNSKVYFYGSTEYWKYWYGILGVLEWNNGSETHRRWKYL